MRGRRLTIASMVCAFLALGSVPVVFGPLGIIAGTVAVAKGANPMTLAGLAGVGDLVLTCTDDQSRNRRMGLGLAQGKSVDEIAAQIGQVVEGVNAARSVRAVAVREQIEMPICEHVYRILHEGDPPADAVTALMNRERTAET